jgi:HAD superfamily hydrolase (TIGR01662 family)
VLKSVDFEGLGLKIKCVMFDFDCTLVNLADFVDWGRAKQLVIQTYLRHGVPESVVKRHEEGGFLLPLLNGVYEELLGRFPLDEAKKIQSAAYDVLEKFETEGIHNAKIISGCLEALRWLRGKGVKIGIASSNSEKVVKEILKSHDLNSFIDVIVARDVTHKLKPHPDQFLLCLDKMGCKPQNSVAVGDGYVDMVAAKRAGVLAIGVSTGRTSMEKLAAAGADKIIKGLHELPEVLLSLDSSLERREES